jgi:nitrogen fixation protein NifU and related proteins
MSDDLRAMYQELILDHSRSPRGFGLLDAESSRSHQLNPTCGDEVTLQLHQDPGTGRVSRITWEGQGCAISCASASMLAELVHDDSTETLERRIAAFRELMQSRGAAEGDEELLADAVVFRSTSRYVARVKCAMLAWVAAEKALGKLAA